MSSLPGIRGLGLFQYQIAAQREATEANSIAARSVSHEDWTTAKTIKANEPKAKKTQR